MFYEIGKESAKGVGRDARMDEMHDRSEPLAETRSGEPRDDAAWAAAVAAAWEQGAAGWERLAAAWGIAPASPGAGDVPSSAARDGAAADGAAVASAADGAALPGADAAPGADGVAAAAAGGTEAACWWDGPPWHGRIAEEEFRAIVAAYVARYGVYTPDLPEREPELLRGWGCEPEPRAGSSARVAA
jgi:hypothetical protein